MYIFPVLQLGAGFVDPDVDGIPKFSGNMFAVLIYYFQNGRWWSRMVVRFTVYVNLHRYVNAVFFTFLTSGGFTNVRLTATLFRTGPFVDYILFGM